MNKRLEEIKRGWCNPALNSYNNKTLEEVHWLIKRVERLEEALKNIKAFVHTDICQHTTEEYPPCDMADNALALTENLK